MVALKLLKQRTRHTGAASTLGGEAIEFLKNYYEERREQGHVITITMMAIELCRQFPELESIHIKVLYRRVRRFCHSNDIVIRRVTHAAQNHEYNQSVMDNWVHYVNQQIKMNKYTADCIVNYDQTNIYFDVSSPNT